MLEIRERARATGQATATLSLELAFEDRRRSRQRVTLSNGEEAALLMPRGGTLRGGDELLTSDGRRVRVVAARELVSTVQSKDAHALLRVAYHLGNRHVPLEIGAGYVRYLHDHVLDDMVRELGLAVVAESAPFEPENGAYGSTAHGHSHEHGHAHEHGHSHDHPHDHDPLPQGRSHVHTG